MGDTRLGRYQLESLLATGGMGEVWLARRDDGKVLVLKRILRHLAHDQGFIDLFVNEARLAARLRHPNIVEVFALEQDEDTWFISMEYVHGKSLRAIIDLARQKGVRVPPVVAVRIVAETLKGLQHAHELKDEKGGPAGIIHRDFSPENVLVSLQGQVKLADFGIARAMSSATTRGGRP
jgi:serine/threonine protein kinase